MNDVVAASSPTPPSLHHHNSLEDAVHSYTPGLLTDSTWPVWHSIDADRWTPAGIAALVQELGPVRVGNSSSGAHVFWNVDMGAAAADEARLNGFRPLQQGNETSAVTMPTEQFWKAESDAIHYYTGSLLEEDGRASLPDLQRGLDKLVETIGRYGGAPPSDGHAGRPRSNRHYLKIWLGTAGATTPMHYDTQHNVYAQLHGTKSFWLVPPYAARQAVHLYPRVHPLSHFVRGFEGGSGAFTRALRRIDACDAHNPFKGMCHHCFPVDKDIQAQREFSGSCMLHYRLEAGEVLYLPPFWLHRAECSSPACASTNVWVASHAMHRMEDVEAMPLPFEGEWGLRTRHAAVLAFLRSLLRWVYAEEVGEDAGISRRHATNGPPPPGGFWFPPHPLTPVVTMERLLHTRWYRAEEELLRTRPAHETVSAVEESAAAAECEPRGVDLAKIDAYARERAVAVCEAALSKHGTPRQPEVSWRGPKLILVHDQLERIAHWATEGDVAATLALLRRLHRCCELSAEAASPELDIPQEVLRGLHGDEL